MTAPIAPLFAPPDIRDLPVRHLHVAMGARLCILCQRVERDPIEDLALRFASVTAAKRFVELVALAGEIWPEPFTIHRPCCTRLTPDEALLVQSIAGVERGGLEALRAVTRGFLTAPESERLFSGIIPFFAARGAAPDRARRAPLAPE